MSIESEQNQAAGAGGPLDPRNVWGPDELDQWARAVLEQQRALVQLALKLNETIGGPSDPALFNALRRLQHWQMVSERIQALREEMQK